jgi:hypothetical protein
VIILANALLPENMNPSLLASPALRLAATARAERQRHEADRLPEVIGRDILRAPAAVELHAIGAALKRPPDKGRADQLAVTSGSDIQLVDDAQLLALEVAVAEDDVADRRS